MGCLVDEFPFEMCDWFQFKKLLVPRDLTPWNVAGLFEMS